MGAGLAGARAAGRFASSGVAGALGAAGLCGGVGAGAAICHAAVFCVRQLPTDARMCPAHKVGQCEIKGSSEHVSSRRLTTGACALTGASWSGTSWVGASADSAALGEPPPAAASMARSLPNVISPTCQGFSTLLDHLEY